MLATCLQVKLPPQGLRQGLDTTEPAVARTTTRGPERATGRLAGICLARSRPMQSSPVRLPGAPQGGGRGRAARRWRVGPSVRSRSSGHGRSARLARAADSTEVHPKVRSQAHGLMVAAPSGARTRLEKFQPPSPLSGERWPESMGLPVIKRLLRRRSGDYDPAASLHLIAAPCPIDLRYERPVHCLRHGWLGVAGPRHRLAPAGTDVVMGAVLPGRYGIISPRGSARGGCRRDRSAGSGRAGCAGRS